MREVLPSSSIFSWTISRDSTEHSHLQVHFQNTPYLVVFAIILHILFSLSTKPVLADKTDFIDHTMEVFRQIFACAGPVDDKMHFAWSRTSTHTIWSLTSPGCTRFHTRIPHSDCRIGQAFADEIFRVFARSHPGIAVQFMNANDDVTRMITRAQSV